MSSSDDQLLPTSQSSSLLTCCSFNVHHFSTPHGRCNLKDLYQYLHLKNFDIVCMNEVYEDSPYSHPLRDLVTQLNRTLPEQADCARPYHYRSGVTNFESNVILSKYPVLYQETKDIGRGERSVLGIKIDHPHIRNVFVTHLDHVRETKRVTQLRKVLDFIHKFINRKLDDACSNMNDTDNKNFILLGDFNSMRMDDYTEKFWNYLIQQRIDYGWEAPATQVTSLLFDDNQPPTVVESGEGQEQNSENVLIEQLNLPLLDCWKVVNSDKKFEGVKGSASSRLDTRIDYVIGNQELLPFIKQSWIDTEEAKGISDHFPVVAVFDFSSANTTQ